MGENAAGTGKYWWSIPNKSVLFSEDDYDDQMKATTVVLIEELDKKISLASKAIQSFDEDSQDVVEELEQELRFFEECQKQLKTFQKWQKKLEYCLQARKPRIEEALRCYEQLKKEHQIKAAENRERLNRRYEEFANARRIRKKHFDNAVKSFQEDSEKLRRSHEEREMKRQQEVEYRQKLYDECMQKLRHYEENERAGHL